MDGVLHGLEGVFEIIFMIGLAFILARRHWFSVDTSMVLTKLVMNISLPLYMVYSLQKSFTHDLLYGMIADLKLPVISILLCYVIARGAVRILHIRRGRQGVFITTTFAASTIFVGLPVNLALFGEVSVPSVMLYYMANTSLYWTIGQYHIMNDNRGDERKIAFISMQTVKEVFSPPLLGFLIGVILLVADISLPGFMLTSFCYVGNLTTPLSLFVVGIEMSTISLESLHWDKDIFWACVGRFIVSPLCVIALIPVIPVSDISMKVFTMQASMPAMATMTLVTKVAGGDIKYCTTICFVTVVLGMFFIPIYMAIIE